MRDIFISYVEEDGGIVNELAEGIEAAGYSVWYYERDGVPGASYLLQTRNAIDQCQAFILLISPNSITSEQVTLEVVRAHEINKSFIPLRSSITHLEFAERQPEWAQALGAATSTLIPPEGPSTTIPQVLRGLKKLSIEPRPDLLSGNLPTGPLSKFERTTKDPALAAPRKTINVPAETSKPAAPAASRKKLYLIAAAFVALITAAFFLLLDDGSSGEEPELPLTAEQFRDQFNNLDAWEKPANWSVDKGWLLINGSPEIGYLSNHRYRNFTANFRLRIDGEGGAAWALRVNERGYYLFTLTGPTDTQYGQFVTYLFLQDEDKLQKVGTPYNLIRPLVVGGEYTITIRAQNNIIIHELKIESTPDGEWDGDEQKFGEFEDKQDTFPAGSIGFRAYTNERFAITNLIVFPPGSDPLQ